MKGILFFLFIILSLLIPQTIKASHFMGGEITWECINSGPNTGSYIFYMKVYRECGGITFGTTQTLNSTSPAGNIAMTLTIGYPKDISPVCNSVINSITCAGAESTGADNTGAMSEYLYESSPVQINGIPPSTGWIFSWGTCCRNPSTNIIASPGWVLRAKMYPYNNANHFPCLDNSPQFGNTAKTVLMSGYPYSFTNAAFDTDLDSLSFEWGQPLITIGNPVPYSASYSYTSPLPGTSMNLNNIPATIDSLTGIISFLSYTQGSFVTNVKVSSYRNNQLIAEVWREIQLIILAGGTNAAPTLTPTITNHIIEDTVNAGDTVSLAISASDIAFHPDGSSQIITINANGQQFGNYIPGTTSPATLDTQNGCPNTPCATLTPAPHMSDPVASPIYIQTQFNWVTSCSHLENKPNGSQLPKTHYFNFEINDDFCPVPAQNNFTFAVTVMPTNSSSLYTEIKSIRTSPNGEIEFKWSPVIDINDNFISYNIYKANVPSGPFVLINSITNKAINSFTYNASQTPAMKYYKIVTYQTNCANLTSSNSSPIFKNIILNTTNIGYCINKLTWNNTTNNNTYFKINRKINGNWTVIDSTTATVYTDTSALYNAEYMVETPLISYTDSLGNSFLSNSNSNTKYEESLIYIGADTNICDNGSLLLQLANGFDSYQWYNGISNNWTLIHGSDFTPGDHNIWLKVGLDYGCEITDTLVLTIDDCTSSIEENSDKINFEIFPNPSSGKFTLDIKSNSLKEILIEIVSIDGKTIYSKEHNIIELENIIKIDISGNAAGSYIIKISNDEYKSMKTINLL